MYFKKNTLAKNDGLQGGTVILAKRGIGKRVLIAFIAIVLIALCVAGAWLYGKKQAEQSAEAEIAELKTMLQEQKEQIQELIDAPIIVNPVAPEINLDIIYSEIGEIGELATEEYLFTDAARYSDSKMIKSVKVPLTEKSFLLKWSGVIKAGVNLELVNIEVNEDEKTIVVSIPSAEILSYQIDNDSVEVYNEKNNIFNRITVEDKIKFDTATEDAMKERAIENGILEKAQNNAQTILRRLLQSDHAIGSNYTIDFIVVEK